MRRKSLPIHPCIWLVLTFGDERQYGGNTGYGDELRKWYCYDSFVPNQKEVRDGDWMIVCDHDRAHGIAEIKSVESSPIKRTLLKCPKCNRGIKKRKTKHPVYRCFGGHVFDEPIGVQRDGTSFKAIFGNTFSSFPDQFGREFLRPGCPNYNGQHSIKWFEFGRMAAKFYSKYPHSAALISSVTAEPILSSDEADETLESEGNGYTLNQQDDREEVRRQIRARRGQRRFRNKLRTRYGAKCLVSGCHVLDVLEAAHISAYRGLKDNHVENGLLLRGDLHTLFDLNLIGIEPSSLTVHLHPSLAGSEYQVFSETKLLCPQGVSPSRDALENRWLAFSRAAAQAPNHDSSSLTQIVAEVTSA